MHRVRPRVQRQARQLRKDQTPAETTLWAHLRANRLEGLSFRRQHPVGPYIADFYCPACKLVVEIDGSTHLNREAYDEFRTNWLNSQGYRVVRFTNTDVRYEIETVLDCIRQICMESFEDRNDGES